MQIALRPELEHVLPGLLPLVVLIGLGHSIGGSYMRARGIRAVWGLAIAILVLGTLASTLLLAPVEPGTSLLKWVTALGIFFAVPLAAGTTVIQSLTGPGRTRPRLAVSVAALAAYLVCLPIGFIAGSLCLLRLHP